MKTHRKLFFVLLTASAGIIHAQHVFNLTTASEE